MNHELFNENFPSLPPVGDAREINEGLYKEVHKAMVEGDRLLDDCEELTMRDQPEISGELRERIISYLARYSRKKVDVDKVLPEAANPLTAHDRLFDAQDVILDRLPPIKPRHYIHPAGTYSILRRLIS